MTASAARRALVLAALEGDAVALSVLADVLAFSGCSDVAAAVRSLPLSVARGKRRRGCVKPAAVYVGAFLLDEDGCYARFVRTGEEE